jgi:hypothetical protein
MGEALKNFSAPPHDILKKANHTYVLDIHKKYTIRRQVVK